jgi:hypothetical protein
MEIKQLQLKPKFFVLQLLQNGIALNKELVKSFFISLVPNYYQNKAHS